MDYIDEDVPLFQDDSKLKQIVWRHEDEPDEFSPGTPSAGRPSMYGWWTCEQCRNTLNQSLSPRRCPVCRHWRCSGCPTYGFSAYPGPHTRPSDPGLEVLGLLVPRHWDLRHACLHMAGLSKPIEDFETTRSTISPAEVEPVASDENLAHSCRKAHASYGASPLTIQLVPRPVAGHASSTTDDSAIMRSPILQKQMIQLEGDPASFSEHQDVSSSHHQNSVPGFQQLALLAEAATKQAIQQEPRAPPSPSIGPFTQSPMQAFPLYSAQASPTSFTWCVKSPRSTSHAGDEHQYPSPQRPSLQAYYSDKRHGNDSVSLVYSESSAIPSQSSSNEGCLTGGWSPDGYNNCHTTPIEHEDNLRNLPPPPGMNVIPAGGFKCDYDGCNAPPFVTQYLLSSHRRVHAPTRPHYCPVEGCPRSEGGKGFKRKNEMIRHGLVHSHPGYVCPFCPDKEHRYPRPDNLQRHVRVHHPDRDRDDPSLRDVLAQRGQGMAQRQRRRRTQSTTEPLPAREGESSAPAVTDRPSEAALSAVPGRVYPTHGNVLAQDPADAIRKQLLGAQEGTDHGKEYTDIISGSLSAPETNGLIYNLNTERAAADQLTENALQKQNAQLPATSDDHALPCQDADEMVWKILKYCEAVPSNHKDLQLPSVFDEVDEGTVHNIEGYLVTPGWVQQVLSASSYGKGAGSDSGYGSLREMSQALAASSTCSRANSPQPNPKPPFLEEGDQRGFDQPGTEDSIPLSTQRVSGVKRDIGFKHPLCPVRARSCSILPGTRSFHAPKRRAYSTQPENDSDSDDSSDMISICSGSTTWTAAAASEGKGVEEPEAALRLLIGRIACLLERTRHIGRDKEETSAVKSIAGPTSPCFSSPPPDKVSERAVTEPPRAVHKSVDLSRYTPDISSHVSETQGSRTEANGGDIRIRQRARCDYASQTNSTNRRPASGIGKHDDEPEGHRKRRKLKDSFAGCSVKDRFPCIFHAGEPDVFSADTKKYKYISHLARHLRSGEHLWFVCERCFTTFDSEHQYNQHYQAGGDICFRSCTAKSCRRWRKRSEILTNERCECITTSEGRWLALFHLKYSNAAPPDLVSSLATVPQSPVTRHDVALAANVIPSIEGESNSSSFSNVGARFTPSSSGDRSTHEYNQLIVQFRTRAAELDTRIVELEREQGDLQARNHALQEQRRNVENMLGLVWEALESTNDPRSRRGSRLQRMVADMVPSVFDSLGTSKVPDQTSNGSAFEAPNTGLNPQIEQALPAQPDLFGSEFNPNFLEPPSEFEELFAATDDLSTMFGAFPESTFDGLP